ncbi:MAG: hypothetical protein AAF871_01365 [Pseudomonadota bacterium]
MSDDASAAGPLIRPYRPEDRDAVREICCDTAYRNKGAEHYFEDREIHADYWSSYYTDVTPDEVWIAEDKGEVIGYFFGCPDTLRFRRAMARRIVPWCLLRAVWRLALGRYKNPVTRRYLWFMVTRGPGEEAPLDISKYPAHYHCNIVESGRGHGLYTTMTLDFLDRLDAAGIHRIHGHITEPAKKGIWDMFDRQYSGTAKPTDVFRSEKPTKAGEYIRGETKAMVNRAWGTSTASFREYVKFLRDKMRL